MQVLMDDSGTFILFNEMHNKAKALKKHFNGAKINIAQPQK